MKKYLISAALLGGLSACSDIPMAPAPAALSAPLAEPSRALQTAPIPNTYIVRFLDNEPNPLLHARVIERTHGAVIKHVYTTALKGAAFAIADAAAQALKADASVMSVEQDQTVRISTTQANPTWGIDRIDQRNRPLSNSYTYGLTGNGVTVYIIDTGINFTHTEYSGRAFTGTDIVTPGGTAVDCNGHGSHVSGTVGGSTYGVAKNVRLVAVRVLDCAGSGTVSGVIAGVDWVTQNATRPSAANMSLGGGFSSTLNQAVENSIGAGITYAIAAGNSAGNACNESPSSAPSAITVGATDINDGFASFSNFGSCVDINAPGVGITSAWIGSNSATNTISGTSMAAPHVAGAAALYLQAFPSATPAQVRTALTSNATPNVISGVPAATPNLLVYTGFLATPPVANFTQSCTALSCNFDGSSTTALPSATYSWTFGDATTGAGRTVNHVYAAAGTYAITLTVTDVNGSSNKAGSVTVTSGGGNQPPVARFTVTCPSQTLSCTADGSSSSDDVRVVSYTWNWGDGSPSQTHGVPVMPKTYATAGTYTVTLTVTDGGGLTNTTNRPVTVPTGVANQPPVATITAPANGSSFTQGANVSFVGSGADPEDGTLTGASLTWTSSIDGVIGTGTTFITNTLSAGTHTIVLTAKDAQGATGAASLIITITAVGNQPPTARFTVNCPSLTLSCTADGSSSSDDVRVVSYTWNWGDGTPSQTHGVPVMPKTYAAAGTYTVTLTVTDGGGLTNTTSKQVTVSTTPTNQPPVARFTVTCAGLSCTADGSSSTDDVRVVSYTWNWGNGSPSQTHGVPVMPNTYAAGGTYTVTLTVTDAGGLTDTTSRQVTVPF